MKNARKRRYNVMKYLYKNTKLLAKIRFAQISHSFLPKKYRQVIRDTFFCKFIWIFTLPFFRHIFLNVPKLNNHNNLLKYTEIKSCYVNRRIYAAAETVLALLSQLLLNEMNARAVKN